MQEACAKMAVLSAAQQTWIQTLIGFGRGKRRASPLLLTTLLLTTLPHMCRSAVENVQVVGTTATQAVLSFNVPDPSNCVVVISTDSQFTTPVNDTNNALFPGSQACNRTGAIVLGARVTFTAGARTSRAGTDGRFYSLALEAFRTHYFRIVSQGVDVATGTFSTINPPFGNTYPEPPPFNPGAPFNIAWPTVRPGADRNVFFTDPQTGIQVTPVTGPDQQLSGGGSNHLNASGALSRDAANNGNWSGAGVPGCGAISAGTPCVNSGANQDALFIQDTPYCIAGAGVNPIGSAQGCSGGWECQGQGCGDKPFHISIDDIQTQITTACDGNTVSYQLALTLDGVKPWTDWQTQACSGQANATFPAAGSSGTPGFPSTRWGTGANKTVFGFWFANQVNNKITRMDLSPRSGTVTVASGVVTWATGDKFRPTSTAAGSFINLGGTFYRIMAVNSTTALTIAAPPADGTYNYQYFNTGVLVRKAAATTGNLLVSGVKFTDWESMIGQMPQSGLVEFAAPVTVNSGAGRLYLLVYGDFDRTLWYIDETTGTSSFLGNADPQNCFTANCASGVSDPGSLNAYNNTSGQNVWTAFNASDPRHFYAFGRAYNSGGRPVLIDQFYNDAGASGHRCPAGFQEITAANCPSYPNNDNIVQNNLTPPSTGRDLQQKAVAYNAAQRLIDPSIPLFDPSFWFFFPGVTDVTKGWVAFSYSSGQNSMGWRIWVDPAQVGVPVVAMHSSYQSYSCTWCGDHGGSSLDGVASIAAANLVQQSNVGQGMFVLQSNTSTDNATKNICTGIADARYTSFNGTSNCFTLTVAGTHPCHPSPNLATEIAPMYDTCDWDGAKTQLRGVVLRTGDFIDDNSDNGEIFVVATMSGNNVQVIRNFTPPTQQNGRISVISAHTAPWTLRTRCNNSDAFHGGLWWCNLLTDPNCTSTGIADWAFEITAHFDYWTTGFADMDGRFKSYADFPTMIRSPLSFIANESGPFNTFGSGMAAYLQSHLGVSREPRPNHTYGIDKNPMSSVNSAVNTLWPQNATKIAGDLWKIAAADVVGNPGANWPAVIKSLPYVMWSGGYLLQDVSGPGCALTGTAPDNWKFGVVWTPGECFAGSQAGDVYVNIPQASHDGKCGPWDFSRNICGSAWDHTALGVNQYYTPPAVNGFQNITDGRSFRKLSMLFSKPNYESVFSSGHPTFSGKFAFGHSDFYAGGLRSDVFLLKLPPIPSPSYSSTARNTFVEITLGSNPVPGANKIRAKFGYAENGAIDAFYCAYNRKEECRTSPIPTAASPYYFASDPSQILQDCPRGCIVKIPAIPGRVVYYKIEHVDAAGNVVATGNLEAKVP